MRDDEETVQTARAEAAGLTPIADAAAIGALLRAQRKGLGLTQAAAAERIGSTQRWVSQVENGKERAEIGAVLRLAGALGLALSATPPLEDPDEPPAKPRRAQRVKRGYRAFLDHYQAALGDLGGRGRLDLAPSAMRACAGEARRRALAAWVRPQLDADRRRFAEARG